MKLNHDRQMRKSIAIIITSILVLSGCNKQQSVSDRLLNVLVYLQPIITQYFIDNKSEIWLLFLIAHSKR